MENQHEIPTLPKKLSQAEPWTEYRAKLATAMAEQKAKVYRYKKDQVEREFNLDDREPR